MLKKFSGGAMLMRGFYKGYGKRFLDLIVAVPALLLLAPVMGCVAVLVRFFLGAPVLFRQERPGFRGKPFTLIKFRTLTEARDAAGTLLPPTQRLTKFGDWLRGTSLDELPGLVNVIKGEMSLVGPRPLLMEYLPLYSPEQQRRHEAVPGITGWAQVNGRNVAEWPTRLALDVWYVDHLSFPLDLKILALTFRQVFKRGDVNLPGYVGATRFTGETGTRG
jgi:lipopolysaccharide/colanic/teichoic acid biosynthesis glycosyltransferase